MNSTVNRSAIAAVMLVVAGLPVAGLPAAVHAVELSGAYDGEGVQLSAAGLYYTAFVERAESPDGPFEYIDSRYFGCTEACEFLDMQILEGTTYWYRMTAIPQYGPVLELGPTAVAIPPLSHRPLGSVASPNPFTQEVSLRFRIPARVAAQEGAASARLTIHDAAGRAVRSLEVAGMARGERSIQWDGRDDAGREVGSGIYLYALVVGSARETGRIVKLR